MISPTPISTFFFFNDTATTEIYTLSLHDALPISCAGDGCRETPPDGHRAGAAGDRYASDRKSTRLNSSHSQISYAVFCLKKKKSEVQGLLLQSPTAPSHNLVGSARQLWIASVELP